MRDHMGRKQTAIAFLKEYDYKIRLYTRDSAGNKLYSVVAPGGTELGPASIEDIEEHARLAGWSED